MKKTIYRTSAGAVAVLFALTSVAYADITVKNTSVVDVDADGVAHMNMKADMHATATLRDSSGVKMEGGKKKGIDMVKHDEDGIGTEHMKGIENAEMHVDEHAREALEKAELHLGDMEGLKADVEADKAKDSGEVEVDAVAKVHSFHDFEHFVAHKAKEDARIKGVSVKDGKVEVAYEEPAELFGFMSTTINAHATVDAKDNVEVSYPWYHIFMKKHVSNASLQSELARAVATERKAVKEGVATTTIQAQVEAAFGTPNLFEIIADTLKKASVKAETEASAE